MMNEATINISRIPFQDHETPDDLFSLLSLNDRCISASWTPIFLLNYRLIDENIAFSGNLSQCLNSRRFSPGLPECAEMQTSSRPCPSTSHVLPLANFARDPLSTLKATILTIIQ